MPNDDDLSLEQPPERDECPAPRQEPGSAPVRSADVPDDSRQFSVMELLALVVFASLLLSGFQWLAPPVFAGAAGAATLIALVVFSLRDISRFSFRLGWWILLAVYALAAGMAIVRG